MDKTISEAQAEGRQYDAIIIPGGGLEPGTNLPQPWVQARLDAALKLSSQTRYFVVLSRGTTHRPPPLDARGFPILESEASASYLVSKGVEDCKRILIESWSLDTIGNAFFACRMICEPMQLSRCLLVTSAFHMPRTRAIFEWVFGMSKVTFDIDYCVSADVGLNESQSSVRVDKEQKSLATLQEKTIPRMNTMAKLSQFLFQEHAAYNTAGVIANNEKSRIGPVPEEGGGLSALKSTY